MPVFIGLDLGSSSARAVAFNEALEPICFSQKQYPMFFPRPGWAEQDPHLILDGCVKALSGTAAKLKDLGLLDDMKAIGVSGFMHSSMAVNHDGAPLTPLLPWADQRTASQATSIACKHGNEALYFRTGCPVHTTYVPCKIRWFKETMPDVAGRAWRFMSAKEWVVGQITGSYVCDRGIASGAGLLNMESRGWDELALRAAGVEPDELNPLVEPTSVAGEIGAQMAASTGLPEGVPVVVGSSDAAMSSLGSGAASIGQIAAMIGTSGAVRMAVDRPMMDEAMRCWCYYLADGRWILGGATNNGGNVLGWFKDLMAVREPISYDDLLALAQDAPAGASGLIFLAFLAGERAPGWNANARGVLLGLALSHGASHIARSILEGTVFQLHGTYAALKRLVDVPGGIVASGGFAKSQLWLEILASVLSTEVEVPELLEGSAAGAAALAMVSTGYEKGLDWTARVRRGSRVIHPKPEEELRYRRTLDVYYKAYDSMAETFDELVGIADGG